MVKYVMSIRIVNVTNDQAVLNVLLSDMQSDSNSPFKEVMTNKKNNFFEYRCYAIYHEEELIGFMNIIDYSDFIELHRLYIYPNFRNRGYGQKASYIILEALYQEGFTEFCIETVGNVRAFWEKVFSGYATENYGLGKLCYTRK